LKRKGRNESNFIQLGCRMISLKEEEKLRRFIVHEWSDMMFFKCFRCIRESLIQIRLIWDQKLHILWSKYNSLTAKLLPWARPPFFFFFSFTKGSYCSPLGPKVLGEVLLGFDPRNEQRGDKSK